MPIPLVVNVSESSEKSKSFNGYNSFNFLQILPHDRHWHAYRQIESIVLKKSETKQNRGEDGKIVYGNWTCVYVCATNIELGDALEFR